MPSALKRFRTAATNALALEGLDLPEGLRRELERFLAHQSTQPKSPFSTIGWDKFSNQHGSTFKPPLTENYSLTMNILPKDNTPAYELPLSFHTRCALDAWRWMEVYGEKGDQVTEGGTLRLLEPFMVPLIALFRGRMIDMPEQPMAETEVSTGGQVKHEVFLIGGALFLIVGPEIHLSGASRSNSVAQLFLRILSAAKKNSKFNLKNPKVYGLLSDFTTFHFYTYDPKTRTFSNDDTMWVGRKRENVCTDMIKVSNKIFGILLTGYIASLEVIMETSLAKGENLDLSPESSSPFTVTNGSSISEDDGSQESTMGWKMALNFANRCQDTFNEKADTVECAEERGIKALELLNKSVSQILRYNSTTFSGEVDVPTHRQLSAMLSDVVANKYTAILKKRYGTNSHIQGPTGTKRKFDDV